MLILIIIVGNSERLPGGAVRLNALAFRTVAILRSPNPITRSAYHSFCDNAHYGGMAPRVTLGFLL